VQAVAMELPRLEYFDYVAGEFMPCEETTTWLLNPNSGDKLCVQQESDPENVMLAVATAWKLYKRG